MQHLGHLLFLNSDNIRPLVVTGKLTRARRFNRMSYYLLSSTGLARDRGVHLCDCLASPCTGTLSIPSVLTDPVSCEK